MKKRKALIVSANAIPSVLVECFVPAVYESVLCLASAAAAKRVLAKTHYDLVVLYGPLQDDSGIEAACQIAGLYNQSVLLCLNAEAVDQAIYECRDYPVFVLGQNALALCVAQAVGFMEKMFDRQEQLEKALNREKQRFENEKTISLCKMKMVEMLRCSEEQAHKRLLKTAMDHSMTKVSAAKYWLRRLSMMASMPNEPEENTAVKEQDGNAVLTDSNQNGSVRQS